jgi:hypothetical protein
MIREDSIKEIQQYITIAANTLGWDDESKMHDLISEVARQIRIHLPHNEKKLRKYVEDAYNKAAFLYNTGNSILFYVRHDRQPVELKRGFNREDLYYLRENKIKYVTEEEFDIIRERLKTDTSKKLCNSYCNRFWKSFLNARRFYVAVSFNGENFDYCDKSTCDHYNK